MIFSPFYPSFRCDQRLKRILFRYFHRISRVFSLNQPVLKDNNGIEIKFYFVMPLK